MALDEAPDCIAPSDVDWVSAADSAVAAGAVAGYVDALRELARRRAAERGRRATS